MSCWHGWHGCGPWYAGSYGEPYGPGWSEPADWSEPDWPVRRRHRSDRRDARERSTEALEATLDELRREIRDLEREVGAVRAAEEAERERS
jgi:hypothetical protein